MKLLHERIEAIIKWPKLIITLILDLIKHQAGQMQNVQKVLF